MRAALYLLLISPELAIAFKFLAFSPQFAVSHANYIAKISDTLVDAGHEVVILAPRVKPSIRGALAKKARVIELPENEFTKRWSAGEERLMDLYWNTSMISLAMDFNEVMQDILRAANSTLHYPGLIEQLRAEKFDAAFTENPLGFGIFHLAGIEKTALAVSFTNFECAYTLTQTPSNPAYVPSLFSSYGDRMSFWERVKNTAMSMGFGLMMTSNLRLMQPLFEQLTPGVTLLEMTSANSLVLLNSEPLLDYPRPSIHRVVEIGGITTATDVEPLSEYWSGVLSLRNRSVILSFGSYIRASVMPEIYKETIRKALAQFPEVTFIWKYEIPDHNVSQGIPNIVETTWMPQVALLNDPRLTAFITHGGQGSTLEAAYAGTPMLMVPTQGDQFRNAAMIKRAGLGDIVQLSELEDAGRFENAIRDLLDNEDYASNARKMAAMLRDRPFSAKEKLVRNMEFLAAHGPLRMLEHEGRNLNFVQYYLIDVALFVLIITIIVLSSIGLACFLSCRCCYRKVHRYSHDPLKKE